MRYLLLVLFLLTACASAEHTPVNISIRNIEPERWEHIAGAARTQIDLFTAIHGPIEEYFTIVVFPDKPDCAGRPVAGDYHMIGNEIHVWAGDFDEVPALYHELCHHVFAQTDIDHEHSCWGIWEQEAGWAVRTVMDR
jgi:hypothetical protein